MSLKKARDYKRDKDLIDLPNEFWGCMSFPICRGTKPRLVITKYFVTKFSGFLFQLTHEDIPVIYSRVTNNSTVVIDEIQDYFPAVAKPLTQQMTQFVTQHGHRGINLLLMGQDHNDCHNLFKRRIDKLIHFTKRDAVGMPNSYSWESYKLSLKGLVKLRSGSGKYNPKYFGLYKSHVDDSIDATNHQDDRANVFKSSAFTFYIPSFLLLLCFAVYYLYSFFHSAPANAAIPNKLPSSDSVVIGHVKSGQSLHVEKPVQPVQQTPSSQSQPDNPPTVKTASLSDPSDYFQNVADKYELQLSGIAEGQTDKGFKFMAMIDALDDNHHLKERFTVKELESMGWQVVRTEYGILVSHGKSSYVVRQRPRDYFGQVSQNVRNSPEISGQK
jgi:zona occludens toxin